MAARRRSRAVPRDRDGRLPEVSWRGSGAGPSCSWEPVQVLGPRALLETCRQGWWPQRAPKSPWQRPLGVCVGVGLAPPQTGLLKCLGLSLYNSGMLAHKGLPGAPGPRTRGARGPGHSCQGRLGTGVHSGRKRPSLSQTLEWLVVLEPDRVPWSPLDFCVTRGPAAPGIPSPAAVQPQPTPRSARRGGLALIPNIKIYLGKHLLFLCEDRGFLGVRQSWERCPRPGARAGRGARAAPVQPRWGQHGGAGRGARPGRCLVTHRGGWAAPETPPEAGLGLAAGWGRRPERPLCSSVCSRPRNGCPCGDGHSVLG